MESQLEIALRIINETGANLFLTGKAGTGKTTFLRQLSQQTRKRMVVLAPTGVAAINAGGVTIHSFFQLDFSPYIPGRGFASGDNSKFRFSKMKRQIINSLDLIVIDEISMVRPDVLDAMDSVLRRFRNPTLPFGGVQLLLIGDLRQLAPVAKPHELEILKPYYNSLYFFDSIALREARFLTIELTKVYRQDNPEFIRLLNTVRDGNITSATIDALNSRYIPGFNPPDSEGYIRLTTHNFQADAINSQRIAALTTDPVCFDAKIDGTFPESAHPADAHLLLKVGAQVMFIKNDSGTERQFYNGMIGTITEIGDDEVTVQPANGEEPVNIGRMEWENISYKVNNTTKEITRHVDGTFSQLPLRLAWAITVHKSQGLTFDRAIINVSESFAPGQTYVALSRCKSLEGLVLDAPIPASAIITDSTVSGFISANTRMQPDDTMVDRLHSQYCLQLISELFDFTPLRMRYDDFHRVVSEYVMPIHPELSRPYKATAELLEKQVEEVGKQTATAFASAGVTPEIIKTDDFYIDKIRNGCKYFLNHLDDILNLTDSTPRMLKNEAYSMRLQHSFEALYQEIYVKMHLLRTLSNAVFTTAAYSKAKARAILDFEAAPPRLQIPKKIIRPTAPTDEVESDHEERAPESKPKKKPQSRTKGYSAMVSLGMFGEGMGIDKIAAERELNRSTICTHLAQAVVDGLLERNQLIADNVYEWLAANYPVDDSEKRKAFDVAALPPTAPAMTEVDPAVYQSLFFAIRRKEQEKAE